MNEWSAESYTAVLAYYAALAPAAGFQGRCAMSIPADIEGKRVLDVCCRKGKGAFALVNCLPFLMSKKQEAVQLCCVELRWLGYCANG